MEIDNDGYCNNTGGNQDLENDNTGDHSPQPDASKLDMRNIEHHRILLDQLSQQDMTFLEEEDHTPGGGLKYVLKKAMLQVQTAGPLCAEDVDDAESMLFLEIAALVMLLSADMKDHLSRIFCLQQNISKRESKAEAVHVKQTASELWTTIADESAQETHTGKLDQDGDFHEHNKSEVDPFSTSSVKSGHWRINSSCKNLITNIVLTNIAGIYTTS
jgi:hypothetical protein